jgi:hypothetical protein
MKIFAILSVAALLFASVVSFPAGAEPGDNNEPIYYTYTDANGNTWVCYGFAGNVNCSPRLRGPGMQ